MKERACLSRLILSVICGILFVGCNSVAPPPDIVGDKAHYLGSHAEVTAVEFLDFDGADDWIQPSADLASDLEALLTGLASGDPYYDAPLSGHGQLGTNRYSVRFVDQDGRRCTLALAKSGGYTIILRDADGQDYEIVKVGGTQDEAFDEITSQLRRASGNRSQP